MEIKYDIMSRSHRIATQMRWLGDHRRYKEIFSLALKVEHMRKRLITIVDINWLMAHYPHVNLSLARSLHKSDVFVITGGYYLSIEHYVKPQTEAQINYGIGIMIESEIKSGIKPKLD